MRIINTQLNKVWQPLLIIIFFALFLGCAHKQIYLTSSPTDADIYVDKNYECCFPKENKDWKYLGETPYLFDLERDRGGWVNPIPAYALD